MICKDVHNIKTQMGNWKGCQPQVVDSIKLLQKGIFQNSAQAQTSESGSIMKMNLMISQCHRFTDHTRFCSETFEMQQMASAHMFQV
jgi:hypothetical protein